jgi:STE24 endopeptidase
LPEGRTRADVLALAREAKVDVGQVYEVDASRRTTASNAYVTGLGRTKRVVLYDNLLKDFSRDEVRLVVAHELGHVHYRDVPRGLLYVAVVAPGALFAASLLTRRLAPDEPRPGPAARWLSTRSLSSSTSASASSTSFSRISPIVGS